MVNTTNNPLSYTSFIKESERSEVNCSNEIELTFHPRDPEEGTIMHAHSEAPNENENTQANVRVFPMSLKIAFYALCINGAVVFFCVTVCFPILTAIYCGTHLELSIMAMVVGSLMFILLLFVQISPLPGGKQDNEKSAGATTVRIIEVYEWFPYKNNSEFVVQLLYVVLAIGSTIALTFGAILFVISMTQWVIDPNYCYERLSYPPTMSPTAMPIQNGIGWLTK
jgi:hypothetical protein